MPFSEYSAFGSTDPVHDQAGDRIRWFCPWYINDATSLERALATVEQADGAEKVGRVTVRLVSDLELPAVSIQLMTERGYRAEARMATADGRVITYIAKCKPDRRSTAADTLSERTMLEGIINQPRKGARGIDQANQQLDGFRLEMVGPDTLSAADIDCLLALHREVFPTFPYDFQTKLALMMQSPDSYLMSQVRSVRNNLIYAFSNLEVNEVRLRDGNDLLLGEYDNSMAATNCPELGRVGGFGSILRLALARQANALGLDLCHAESRAGAAPINSISYHLGMQFGGTLEKHLLISGRNDINYQALSRFESMNVWYLNRNHMASL